MLDLSNHALSITYLILWAAVFARQICLPVPANLFLLTAGALARGGGLNMSLVLCVGVLGCIAGDLVWFEAGRHGVARSCGYFAPLAATPTTVPKEPTDFSVDGVCVL